MYHTFFELNEPAFSIAVNPRYLYMSGQHKEALAHLLYGVAGGCFVMLTGEVGTGKTTIIRCLLEQMPENTDIAIVMNPTSKVPELLSIVCDELGANYIKDEPSVKDLTDALHQHLLKSHTQGRNTILLIDEAQLLSVEALEQIRLLTNLETTTQKLLHIILVGQPELKTLLSQPQLRQLSQRITARFHLEPLTLNETRAYIHHRLKIAGMLEGRTPFPEAIIKKIQRFSGGIPRLINVICERCLIGAYASDKIRVNNTIFDIARKEVIGGLTQTQQHRFRQYAVVASFILAIILIAGSFLSTHYSAKSINKQATSSASVQTSRAASSASQAAISHSSSSAASIQIRNNKAAEDILFTYLGFPLAANTRPCGKNSGSILQCEKVSRHTWSEVAAINRPAILMLATPEKFSTYVVLIGINQDNALILNEQAQRVVLPLEKIGYAWTGDIMYLWNKHADFTENLTLGDSSNTIQWLAQEFAKMDKQAEPLSDTLFNLALHERIKLFQRSKGLQPDGIINQATLMKFNEALVIDKTLLTDF